MLERWSDSLDLPSGFSFRGLMSTESQLLVWKGEGLPADDLSQVKGKRVTKQSRERTCRCFSSYLHTPYVAVDVASCNTSDEPNGGNQTNPGAEGRGYAERVIFEAWKRTVDHLSRPVEQSQPRRI